MAAEDLAGTLELIADDAVDFWSNGTAMFGNDAIPRPGRPLDHGLSGQHSQHRPGDVVGADLIDHLVEAALHVDGASS